MRRRALFTLSTLARIFLTAIAALLLSSLAPAFAAFPTADIDTDPMFALKEGWAWPIIVVAPPEGWESPEGEAVKYSMRTIEREISRRRDAVQGREIVFMFASDTTPEELPAKLEQWRKMGALAIVSYAGGELDGELARGCAFAGPPVVFCGGEEIGIMNPTTGEPFPYLFALDLHYFARANAIAEAASSLVAPGAEAGAAVMSDRMSDRLARGARLCGDFMRARGIRAADVFVPAFRQDQFSTEVREMEYGGVRLFAVWLDAMAALSVWQSARVNWLKERGEGERARSAVFYAGYQHPILLDADGLLLVDKDAPLERNAEGIAATVTTLRDSFNFRTERPVLSARAYALAEWVTRACCEVSRVTPEAVREALATTTEIPLMDERIEINPATHRPVMRKFCVLEVGDRQYRTHSVVEVYSAEVREVDLLPPIGN